MDGNNRREIEALRAKSEEFADCIRTGFVTKTGAWHALSSTIMKTLEYPMIAINLTKKEWDYIMRPILKHPLPRAGLVRTFPHAICTVLACSYYGFNIMHPYYKQHYLQLQACLGQTMRKTITNDLIRANLEQLRLEVGLPTQDGD